jgi:hypothetical protein
VAVHGAAVDTEALIRNLVLWDGAHYPVGLDDAGSRNPPRQ